MELTLTEKKDNVLQERMEVKGTVKFEGSTPSNAQISEELAKQLKTDVGKVVLRHIYTTYSKHEAKFEGVVYNSAEGRKKTERRTPQEKKKMAEEIKAAAEEKKKAKEAAKKE